jgi:L-2,4-diaminobutyric acid acetyltransferase
VAEDRAGLAGLVCGYRPPAEPEVFFVWQVGVHERARRRGLAVRLIRDVLDSGAAPRFRFLEATVADDNEPSRRLFTGLARNLGAACRVTDGFTADQFSPLSHPAEPRYRIGPIGSTS